MSSTPPPLPPSQLLPAITCLLSDRGLDLDTLKRRFRPRTMGESWALTAVDEYRHDAGLDLFLGMLVLAVKVGLPAHVADTVKKVALGLEPPSGVDEGACCAEVPSSASLP